MNKKLIATLLTAAMVVVNCVPALAGDNDNDVTGTGGIEYDNSEAISYDSIQLPTLVSSKYNFTIDPTNLLHSFNSDLYSTAGTGIYFKSATGGASISELDSNPVDLYKKTYTKQTAGNNGFTGVVTAIDDTANSTSLTVNPGYCVWTPGAAFTGSGASGYSGTFVELNASIIEDYFEISDTKDEGTNTYPITLKATHLSGNNVCSNDLYLLSYDSLGTITDNFPTVKIGDYVKVKADGSAIEDTDGVLDVYKDGTSEKVKAAKADIKFTEAPTSYNANTDKVNVVNRSTKKKVVKAEITISNVKDLTFIGTDSFTGKKDASVFFKVTDGGEGADHNVVFVQSDDKTTATATYTAELEGLDGEDSILYQGAENSKTGGHNYLRFEKYEVSPEPNSFWITAKANTTSESNSADDNKAIKDAWKAYGDAVADETGVRPTMNVVYTVTDYEEAPTTYTVTYNANYGDTPATATETVEEGSHPQATGSDVVALKTRTDGYTFKFWGAANNATEAVNLDDISSGTTLFAIWEKDEPVTGEGLVAVSGQAYDYTATFTKGTAYDINFTGVTTAEWATTVDGAYATSNNITVGTNKVTIAAGNWAGASVGSDRFVKVSNGEDDYIIKFTVGGPVTGTGMTVSSASNIDYEATFTKGVAYDINFTGVTTATWASAVDGTYNTSNNIGVGTDKVTIAAANWSGANANDVRFVKVSDGTYTYTIKFTIATN